MRSIAILAVMCGLAAADSTVSVAVGDTAKRDVGYARGLLCDDVTIVSAEISTDTARDTNVVSFTGLKVGRTMCRAGTQVGQTAFVFTIDVTAKKSAPRR
jgi:hypothetical protein